MTDVTDHIHSPIEASSITKKLGPLPIWAWAAIPAIAYVGYQYFEASRNNTNVPTSDSGTATYSDATGSTDYNDSLGGSTSGYTVTPSSGIVTTGPASATTNAQWGADVVDALVAAGINATQATNSIADYLSGKTLTTSEAATVNTALSTYGSPPEGLLPVNVAPVPTQTTTPKTTTVKTTTAKHKLATPHLTVANNNSASPTMKWNAIPNASEYLLVNNSNGNHKHLTATSFQPGNDGTFTVQALGTGNYTNSSVSNAVSMKHKKAVKTSTKAKASSRSSKTYTVKSGDSLFSIAQHFYGNGNDYMKIYNANKGKIGSNPSLIHAGTVLTIPKD